MQEQTVSIQFKAHYYTLGTPQATTRQIWFVLHGYGQLSKFFLHKFNVLADAGVYVVAPEGLSKFYLEDVTSGSRTGNTRVGATWMTKENRLTDIENYITYLNSVYTKEVPANFRGEITMLGFSQGAATATRWAIESNLAFQRLILWGGILPPDMNFEKAHEALKDKKLIEVFGKNDPYLTDAKLKEVTAINERLAIKPEIIEFEGGHEMNDQVLLNLLK